MPPTAKYTREEITNAALSIVRADGIQALTARALGARLSSSSRPIFTVFQSMNEVHQEVIKAAKAIYAEYIQKGLSEEIPFRGVGSQYILFAVNEPKLFQLLFMAEQAQIPNLSGVLSMIDENYDTILDSIKISYGMDSDSAQRLYRHLWIYTHGIATLCVTKMCRFTGEEISTMMTEIFVSLLKNIKGEQWND